MKQFIVIRVPVTLDEGRNPVRRSTYAGPGTTIVAECDSRSDAEDRVGAYQRGDVKHHYYGMELRLMGDPERRTAIAVAPPKKRTVRPRLVAATATIHQLEHKKG